MTPEGKVKQWCRKKGGAFDHYFPGHVRVSPRGGPFSQSGVSDDILCWRSVFIAIEVKPTDGEATTLQLSFLKEVIAAGGVGAVLKGRDTNKLELIRNRALDVIQRREL
jgi:hypothetical protein